MRLLQKLCASLALLLAAAAPALGEDGVDHYSVGDLDVMVIRDADVSMGQQLLPGLAEKAPEFVGVFANAPVPAVDQTFYLKKGPPCAGGRGLGQGAQGGGPYRRPLA